MEDFRHRLVRRIVGFPAFDPIQVGCYRLSVQAGPFCRSRPRSISPLPLPGRRLPDLLSVGWYTHWEVALFRGDDWLLAADPIFEGLAVAEYLADTVDICVGSYVPTAAVQALFERLLLEVEKNG